MPNAHLSGWEELHVDQVRGGGASVPAGEVVGALDAIPGARACIQRGDPNPGWCSGIEGKGRLESGFRVGVQGQAEDG